MQYVWLIEELFLDRSEPKINVFLDEQSAKKAFIELKSYYRRTYELEEEDEYYFSVEMNVIAYLRKGSIWQNVKEFEQTLQ